MFGWRRFPILHWRISAPWMSIVFSVSSTRLRRPLRAFGAARCTLRRAWSRLWPLNMLHDCASWARKGASTGMTTLVVKFGRQIAAALIFLVATQMSEAATLPLQEPQQQPAQQAQPVTVAQASSSDAQPVDPTALPQAPAPAQNPEPGFSARSQDPQQQDAQKPVGTAAGPSTRPTGVAGSRPSGAAIAPAKQRRVKAIVIRVALIAAGAAAAGAVIGLSRESPSRPQ